MKKIALYFSVIALCLLIIIVARTWFLPDLQPSAKPYATELSRDYAPVLAKSISFRTLDANNGSAASFEGLFEYLRTALPRVHQHMQVLTVNRHSRLFIWEGRNKNLLPGLFLAHSDVVPAAVESWDVDPFLGARRDGYIWGRGAMDNKSTIVGMLAAAEELLEHQYVPPRTLYFAIGHDEETGGSGGAAAIARYLQDRNLKMAYILDEGGPVIDGAIPGLAKPAALIGIAEKGYLTVRLSSHEQGGHSAMPPSTTALTRLLDALSRINARPMPARFADATRQMFLYLAPHMDWFPRMLFANLWLSESLIVNKLAHRPSTNATIRSTGVVTVVEAGERENVLPEQAQALINYRLLPGDSDETVLSYIQEQIEDSHITVSIEASYIPASATTPTDSAVFSSLQTSIAEVFPAAIIAPFMTVVATDSKHYRSLSDNIFRFLPLRMHNSDLSRIHGRNERISEEDLQRLIIFYMRFIENG